MQETTKQAIGVVAFALNVWGNLELTKQTNRGHVIRLCSNACWLLYSPLVGAWALFANHMTFAAINVLGFYRWKKIEVAREQRPVKTHPLNCAVCDFNRFLRSSLLWLVKQEDLPETRAKSFRLLSKFWISRSVKCSALAEETSAT